MLWISPVFGVPDATSRIFFEPLVVELERRLIREDLLGEVEEGSETAPGGGLQGTRGLLDVAGEPAGEGFGGGEEGSLVKAVQVGEERLVKGCAPGQDAAVNLVGGPSFRLADVHAHAVSQSCGR